MFNNIVSKDFNIGIEGIYEIINKKYRKINLNFLNKIIKNKPKIIDNFLIIRKNGDKDFKNQITITIYDFLDKNELIKLINEFNINNKESEKNNIVDLSLPFINNFVYEKNKDKCIKRKFKFFKEFKYQLPGLENFETGIKIIETIKKFFDSFDELESYRFEINEKPKINMQNKSLKCEYNLDLGVLNYYMVNVLKIDKLKILYNPSSSPGLIYYYSIKYNDKIFSDININDIISNKFSSSDQLVINITFNRSGRIPCYGNFIDGSEKKIINHIVDILNGFFDYVLFKEYQTEELEY